ncbi:MAG: hypothetical protein D6812_06675, partial [Deltaproteobacteria bacterium]
MVLRRFPPRNPRSMSAPFGRHGFALLLVFLVFSPDPAEAMTRVVEIGEGKGIVLYRRDGRGRLLEMNFEIPPGRYEVVREETLPDASGASSRYVEIRMGDRTRYWIRFDPTRMRITQRQEACSAQVLAAAESRARAITLPWLERYQAALSHKGGGVAIRRFRPTLHVAARCDARDDLTLEVHLSREAVPSDSPNALPLPNADRFLIKEIILSLFDALLLPPETGGWETLAYVRIMLYDEERYRGFVELSKGAYFNLGTNRTMAEFWSRVYRQ